MVDDDRLLAFLEGLGDALRNKDLSKVADCWATPGLVLSDTDAIQVTTPAQIQQLFAPAIEAYQTQGITATSPEITRVQRFSQRLLEVEVRWAYLDAQGNQHGGEVSGYLLWIDEDGAPRIRVALPW